MSERSRSWVELSAVVFSVCGLLSPAIVCGQVAPRPVIAKGEVTANDVYVRSGDSLNHYTICKLKAGDHVSIVSERGDWYEILPPSQAYSLISGDYVDSTDGRHGIVNGNNVRVRAGSVLNDNKYTVQLLLSKGSEVTILGRNPDGFLKIAPPEGATVWVNKSFVATGSDARIAMGSKVPAENRTGGASASPKTMKTPAPTTSAPTPTEAASASTASPSADGDATPAHGDAVVTKSDALARIDKTPQRDELARIDTAVNAELRKPVPDRKLKPYLERYQAIAKQTKDVVAQKYAQARATQVSDMIALIDTVQQLRRLDEEAASKRRGFQEGRAGIRTVTPSAPIGFDGKGVLKRSAVYPAGSPIERYRLVDVSSGADRTIAYVEIPGNSSLDAASLVGQYVGVRASAKRWEQGSVDPLPIYVAGEIVALDKPTQAHADSDH